MNARLILFIISLTFCGCASTKAPVKKIQQTEYYFFQFWDGGCRITPRQITRMERSFAKKVRGVLESILSRPVGKVRTIVQRQRTVSKKTKKCLARRFRLLFDRGAFVRAHRDALQSGFWARFHVHMEFVLKKEGLFSRRSRFAPQRKTASSSKEDPKLFGLFLRHYYGPAAKKTKGKKAKAKKLTRTKKLFLPKKKLPMVLPRVTPLKKGRSKKP